MGLVLKCEIHEIFSFLLASIPFLATGLLSSCETDLVYSWEYSIMLELTHVVYIVNTCMDGWIGWGWVGCQGLVTGAVLV
jgi:hypothetical protein